MTPSELKKLLGRKGVKITAIEHGAKHDMWIDEKGRFSRIPRHGKDLKPGTVRGILKDFGI